MALDDVTTCCNKHFRSLQVFDLIVENEAVMQGAVRRLLTMRRIEKKISVFPEPRRYSIESVYALEGLTLSESDLKHEPTALKDKR